MRSGAEDDSGWGDQIPLGCHGAHPGMTGDDEVLLPGDNRISINQLKERYQKLGEVYNLSELISDLYERRYLNGPADRLCQQNDYRVVVFGHTHNALIDMDFFLVKDRIYANTGCFCKDKAYCVEIDKGTVPYRLPERRYDYAGLIRGEALEVFEGWLQAIQIRRAHVQ